MVKPHPPCRNTTSLLNIALRDPATDLTILYTVMQLYTELSQAIYLMIIMKTEIKLQPNPLLLEENHLKTS